MFIATRPAPALSVIELAQKLWIVPIPGTTKLHRLEENLGGVDIEFCADELADVTTAASNLQLVGDLLPKAYSLSLGSEVHRPTF